MIIIGCDYHPGFQQIAFVDTDTGELNERKLGHREEAEQFYRQLKVRGKKVADEENRDLRQLLWHRHRMVQMRTRIMNQLHVLALNEGVRRKKAAAMRTSHCPAEGATTWPRTRTVRGNTPAIRSATTKTAKPDRNEWVRAA